MSGPNWVWRAETGASPQVLTSLQAICPFPLPQSYVDLLAQSDGAEAGISVDPLWLVIYPASEALDIAASGAFRDAFPNLFVFGGSGDSEAYAFDLSPDRIGAISIFDTANTVLAESVRPVAASFDDLLELIDT
nr:SMI1/KNR4 family protein [uncultured Sphingomonas sp.]